MRRSSLLAIVLASGIRAQALPDLESSALSLALARVWEIPALGNT